MRWTACVCRGVAHIRLQSSDMREIAAFESHSLRQDTAKRSGSTLPKCQPYLPETYGLEASVPAVGRVEASRASHLKAIARTAIDLAQTDSVECQLKNSTIPGYTLVTYLPD
jgi:hypothetical protein